MGLLAEKTRKYWHPLETYIMIKAFQKRIPYKSRLHEETLRTATPLAVKKWQVRPTKGSQYLKSLLLETCSQHKELIKEKMDIRLQMEN